MTDMEQQREARKKALRLLEHMDRTEKGLTDRLLRAGFSEELAEDAVSYVKDYGTGKQESAERGSAGKHRRPDQGSP